MMDSASAIQPIYSTLADDPDLGEIVEMFAQEIPDRVATLLDQLDAADWEGLRRTAHQLKGAAGSYGFDDLTPAAANLEQTLIQQQPEEDIRHALDALTTLCYQVRAGMPD